MRSLGYAAGTVRDDINAFHRQALVCSNEKSSRPHSARSFPDEGFTEPFEDLLPHSPRILGKPTGLWTLNLLAKVC